MKKLGKELEFISWIKRDGSGTIPASENKDVVEAAQEERFTLSRLSMSEDTYIATGFNVFVVRLKEPQRSTFQIVDDEATAYACARWGKHADEVIHPFHEGWKAARLAYKTGAYWMERQKQEEIERYKQREEQLLMILRGFERADDFLKHIKWE